jgi:alkanesulfonate monooxygenase SsuD/methylene tetrahydromethanopterin reductase-like flavin-dependent oxidoreductase (luciferase family)
VHLVVLQQRAKDVARRAAAIGRDVDELRSNSPLVGTPAEIVDKLGAWQDIGVRRAYAQLLDLSDLAHLELFAGEVMSQLA